VTCADISAVIVTKGDVDLSPILESLRSDGFEDIVVWDNSKRPFDVKVFGRYAAVAEAKHEFIYVQDDDCIVHAFPKDDHDARIIGSDFDDLYKDRIICNVPSADHRKFYEALGMSLVGWGAVFHRSLVDFHRYSAVCDCDDLFLRECDRVFTALNPFYNVDFPITHLEHAKGADRMGRETRHGDDLAEIQRRIALVKAAGHAELSGATR
jgi:hypothetical protein